MQSCYNRIVTLPYSKFTFDHVDLLSDSTNFLIGLVHFPFRSFKKTFECCFSFHTTFSSYTFHSYTFHSYTFFIRILFSLVYFSFVYSFFNRIRFFIRILFIRIPFFIRNFSFVYLFSFVYFFYSCTLQIPNSLGDKFSH